MMRTASLTIFLTCMLGAATAGATATQLRAKGELASVAWFDANGNAVITAQRIDAATTFLGVSTFGCDATSCSGYFGFGTIPSADFGVNGIKATLDTDLANDPDFSMIHSVFDFATGVQTDTPVTSGTITVFFTKNGISSHEVKGILTDTIGGLGTIKQVTDRTTDSAAAVGTFLGVPIPEGANAEVGTNRGNLISIDPGKK